MLANVQTYVFPFIKQTGEGRDTAFSRYMKDTVSLIPAAKVLAKVVDSIDAMVMTVKKEQSENELPGMLALRKFILDISAKGVVGMGKNFMV